jgi:hypothetical protein
MTAPAALLRDLYRARAVFQQRTILAVIGHHTGDRPMTAPTLQDRLRLRIAPQHDERINHIMHRANVDRSEAADALDAAQARIAALEEILLAIEMRTATGEGLSPDEAAIIHDMANVRPTDPPASDKPS